MHSCQNLTRSTKCKTCNKYITDRQSNHACDNCHNFFHIRCTHYKVKEFQKLISNPNFKFKCTFCMFYKCGKCSKPVFEDDNALQCDSECKEWFHLRCTTISKTQYVLFQNNENTDTWICYNCYVFPFSQLNNIDFIKLFADTNKIEQKTSKLTDDKILFYDNCSVCNRKIMKNKIKKGIFCGFCKHIVHRKCSGVSLNELITNSSNFLENWACITCMQTYLPFTNLERDELFKLTFNSNTNCQCKISCNSMRRDNIFRFFNHIDNNKDKTYGPDPDNYLGTTLNLKPHFDYYTPHDFHKLIKNMSDPQKGFSLLHTNICSLKQNFEKMEYLIKDHEIKFDIVALSETWTPESKSKIFQPNCMKGYHEYVGCNGSSLKSGCGFYINNTLKYLDRKDLDVKYCDDTNEFQGKWIEIINNKSINTVVGVYYRHPKKKSDHTFIDHLKFNIDKLKRENKIIIITGDFNYDLLTIENNVYAYDFINTMFSNYFQPCIIEPTRVIGNNRPSLIDNIFINTIEKEIYSGNLISKLSDHMPNFIIIQNFISRNNRIKKQYRDFANFNNESYLEDLSGIEIGHLLDNKSINVIYDHFHNQFQKIVDKHAPWKTKSIKELKWDKKPWITKGIQKSIKNKIYTYKKFIKTKDNFWYIRYRNYRNSLRKLIRTSKQNHYQHYFNQNATKTKKIWMGVNQIIHKQKSKINDIFLNEDGEIITDQKRVSNKFNTYYTNVAQNLTEKLGRPNNKYQDYLKNPNKHSIFLNEIEPDEVLNLLLKIDSKKSADVYGFSPKLIKLAAPAIYINLTRIFNISFRLGQFPDKLKTAKVIPIHKANSKLTISNYRPISLLPILSKIFEKIMHCRIMSFLKAKDVLFKGQFGFQANKSTEHVIIDIHSKIIDSLNKKENPCCIFLDFAKAFDTVNHSILLNKLNYCGIRGQTLKWFESYLNERQQCVELGNTQSNLQTVAVCGLFQSSLKELSVLCRGKELPRPCLTYA